MRIPENEGAGILIIFGILFFIFGLFTANGEMILGGLIACGISALRLFQIYNKNKNL